MHDDHRFTFVAVASQKDQEIAALRRGNAKLIEALMGMCEQHMALPTSVAGVFIENRVTTAPDYISCDEYAMNVLENAGFAERVKLDDGKPSQSDWVLLYDKLEERSKESE